MLKKINEHNKFYENGQVSYELGLNVYGDMSDDDDDDGETEEDAPLTFIDEKDAEIPDSIDWRTKGAVTSVKQQGQCNACWAFGASGALEGAHFIKTGQLVELSEQNLVDCVYPSGTQCYGDWAQNAYDYIKNNGGIDTLASYPYTDGKGDCKYNSANSGATIQSYVVIPKDDEQALTKAIGTIGPVTVDINDDLIKNYKSGVFYDPNCSKDLNHILLAVGYGTDPQNGDYYILKNSWSSGWGEDGYIRMARNKGNLCGIASDATYPVV